MATRLCSREASWDEFVESDAAAATSHTAAEGAEQATEGDMGRSGTFGTLKQMALKTEPRQRLEDVESPWNPDLGGMTRIYRGIQKATGVEGLPAIADIMIGVAEFVYEFELEGDRPDRGDGGEQMETESEDEETGGTADPAAADPANDPISAQARSGS